MKKNWIYFIGGVVVGAILTIAIVAFVGIKLVKEQEEDKNTTMFETPGDVIDVKSFRVFQVIDKETALAHGEAKDCAGLYGGAVYKLTNDEGKYYYDDEIVKVPKGMVARQIGLFQYNATLGQKTVPIIKIMNK